MKPALRQLASPALLVLLALAAPFASAEKADRSKPVNIEADRVTVDDKNKIHIFEGHVATQYMNGEGRPDMGGTICIGLADAEGAVTRQARLVGGRDWVRIGATELGLDCLRRHLLGLPVDERIDFERR